MGQLKYTIEYSAWKVELILDSRVLIAQIIKDWIMNLVGTSEILNMKNLNATQMLHQSLAFTVSSQ